MNHIPRDAAPLPVRLPEDALANLRQQATHPSNPPFAAVVVRGLLGHIAALEHPDRCAATVDGQRCERHGQVHLTIAFPTPAPIPVGSPIPPFPSATIEVTILLCLECAAPAVGDGTGMGPVPCLQVKSGRPWLAQDDPGVRT